jgi:hypothetical protein
MLLWSYWVNIYSTSIPIPIDLDIWIVDGAHSIYGPLCRHQNTSCAPSSSVRQITRMMDTGDCHGWLMWVIDGLVIDVSQDGGVEDPISSSKSILLLWAASPTTILLCHLPLLYILCIFVYQNPRKCIVFRVSPKPIVCRTSPKFTGWLMRVIYMGDWHGWLKMSSSTKKVVFGQKCFLLSKMLSFAGKKRVGDPIRSSIHIFSHGYSGTVYIFH